MRQPLLVLLCVGVLAGVPAAAVPAAEVPDTYPSGSLDSRTHSHPLGESAAAQSNPDRIVISFQLKENGTAAASVTYWNRLDNETRVRAFEDRSRDIRSNRSQYVQRFGQLVRQMGRTAERRTGREMSISDVTVRAHRTPQGFGIVRYSYRWDGFAATPGDRLKAGSVLGGLYLSEETRLVVSWPSDYEVENVVLAPSERRDYSVIWAGPMTVSPSGPRIALGQKGESLSGVPLEAVPFLGFVGAIVMGGFLVRKRRRVRTAGPATSSHKATSLAAHDGVSGDDTASSGTTDLQERELLSNQEILLRELERRGGRAKQKDLVELLDWSASTGSRVVSKLRETDQIETFRIGNQNVLAVPGEADLLDPDGAESEETSADAGS